MFTRKGEEIILHPKKPVQLIIIGRENPNSPVPIQPIIMSEVQAFGTLLHETLAPQMPPEEPIPESCYVETRRAIAGTQKVLFVQPIWMEWRPRVDHKDVVLGIVQDRPVAMAVKRQNARIVVIFGIQVIDQLPNATKYDEWRHSLKQWLTNGKHNNAEFVRVESAYKPGDIILMKRTDKFDVEKVYSQLTSGENSAVVGFIHGDGEDNLRQLLARLEIEYVRNGIWTHEQDIDLQSMIPTMRFTPLAYELHRYVKSWTLFRTKRIDDAWSWEEWRKPEVQKEIQLMVQRFDPYMRHIAPCVICPYKKNPHTDNAVYNYNVILLRQTGETCTTLPGLYYNSLDVAPTMSPTNITATIHAPFHSGFIPTSAYAKPGEGFSWTVLENSHPNFHDQHIRINCQTDGIEHHGSWLRTPVVSTRIPLSAQGQTCSPHGGPIFLQLPAGVNVTIRFENVYKHPYVDLRDPKSIERFPQEVEKNRGVLWTVVNGENMVTALLTGDVIKFNATSAVLGGDYMDKLIKTIHNYRGTDYTTAGQMVFACDVQIWAGYGHAGYPMMGFLSWSEMFSNWNDISSSGGSYYFVHEIGHNLQVGPATLLHGGETTNEVYLIYSGQEMFGKLRHGADRDVGKWQHTTYNGVGLGYYTYLHVLFGYGLIGNVFTSALRNSDVLHAEEVKAQYWLQQVCNETGYNLLPFHELWNFPVTEETRSICDPLPCFFPEDEFTAKAPDKVSKILTAYGKECIRHNPKQVVFRGDLWRGVDVRGPQFVFLHDDEEG
ncbi:protein FAM115 [Clonorchis sinensis]|uniref:Protein FAM115 n=1 Tax=Clonorchis sinensis TaxID=79923 RepID=G7YWB8_CLOSI|nr:protein FAM115 [Clonorchis sinensis]